MSNQIMNGTYTSPNLPPEITGLGEYSDRDLLAELKIRGAKMNNDEIKKQVMALKRPSHVEAHYLIEAELDDIVELIKKRETAIKDKLLATNSGIIDINGRRVDNMVSHEQIKEIFGE